MSTLGQWLRGQGFTVDDRPVPGRSSTWTGVRTIMIHHTAGSEAASAEGSQATFVRTNGPNAPLYQLMLGVSGRVWICSEQRSGQPEPGRASHAGEGGPAFGMPRDRANESSLGIGVQCNGSHPLSTHRDQYAELIRLTAALCRRYGLTEANVLGHKEWTPRKIDPRDDMARIRRDVRAALQGSTPAPEPPAPAFRKDRDMLIQAPSGSWWILHDGNLCSITAQTAANGRAGGLPAFAADSASWSSIVSAYPNAASSRSAMLAEGEPA